MYDYVCMCYLTQSSVAFNISEHLKLWTNHHCTVYIKMHAVLKYKRAACGVFTAGRPLASTAYQVRASFPLRHSSSPALGSL